MGLPLARRPVATSVGRLGAQFGLDWLAERLIVGGVSALVLALVGVPLAMLLFSSVRSTADVLPFEATSFTLDNYAKVFLDSRTYELLFNTFSFGLGAVLLGLVIAGAFAWLLERTNVPARQLAYACVLAPMAIPPMMIAIAWILLASPSIGLVNIVLRAAAGGEGDQGPFDIYSLGGMVFVMALAFVPSMFLMISGAFRNLDPAMEEAARMSGAGRLMVLRCVTLPLLRPALLAAAIYFSVVVVGAFDIPAFLGLTTGIHVFSTKIYLATHPQIGLPDYGLASTYAVIMLALAVVLIAVYRRCTRNAGAFATVTGKGYRPQPIDLGPWRYLALAAIVGYLLLAVVLPLAILLWASLLPYYSPPSLASLPRLSFENYVRAWNYPGMRDILRNSLIVLVATATITMAITLITAWLAVRGRARLSSLPDTAAFLNIGIPGIVLALGMIFVFLTVPIPIYGTIWIIVVALTAHFLPFGSRVLGAAILQVHTELEEAARVSGASWWTTLRRIVVPLLLPALVNAWVWVAVHAVRELGISLLLFTRGNGVLSTLIWTSFEQEARIGFAATLGVLLVLLSLTIALVARSIYAGQFRLGAGAR
jgi:iron(III) transport system permease protein